MALGAVDESAVVRRFASDQLLTLAKLVVENALQPIVEVGTGAVFGYESLLRGHDRLGFSSPLDLLDQAAETGHLQHRADGLAQQAQKAAKAGVEASLGEYAEVAFVDTRDFVARPVTYFLRLHG